MSPEAVATSDTQSRTVQSVITSGLSPEERIRQLEEYGIDWYLSDGGDLMIKYWQVGAEGFVSPEHVARIQAGRPRPNEAEALDWVSSRLGELRQQFGGRWIAVVGNAVVSSAATLPQLLQQMQDLGIERPFITEIPAGQVTWNMTFYAAPLVRAHG